MHSRRAQRTATAWILLGSIGIGLLCIYPPLLERIEGPLTDRQFQLLRLFAPRPALAEIMLVGIDEETVEVTPEPVALWHRPLGEFMQAMAEAQAASVLFDIALPNRSRNLYGTDLDRMLMKGIVSLRAAKVAFVLGEVLDERGQLIPAYSRFKLVAGPERVGLLHFRTDADRVIRRFEPYLGTDGSSGAVAITKLAAQLDIHADPGLIPFDIGPAYNYLPMHRVLELYQNGDHAALTTTFSGKHVIVGSVFAWEDQHAQPVNLAEWQAAGSLTAPGFLLHAQTLRALLGPGLIQSIPGYVLALLVVLCALTGAIRNAALAALTATAAILATLCASTLLLRHNLHLPMTPFLATLLCTTAFRAAFAATWRIRERKRLKSSFGRYVSPLVMQEILAGRLGSELGGQHVEICVLFSDIRGFTTRSEHMHAADVTRLLNRYFNEMTEAIHAHQGTLDKFMGDGIMAFFGAPGPLANAAESAYAAAIDMLERLPELNRELVEESIDPIKIGIGLHIGKAVVGHVGSETRHEFTAIGDVVNVAARVEGLTKQLGSPLLCSDEVRARLTTDVPLQLMGEQPIRGRAPMRLWGYPATEHDEP